jgi:hypothetical protein
MLREYKPTKFDANYYGEQVQGNPAVLAQPSKSYNPPEQLPPFASASSKPLENIAKLNFVTQDELEELKTSINDSFSEVVNLHLELRRDLDLILERLDKHNARSGHKI